MNNDIEVTVFDKPSGGIIALVTGSVGEGRRARCRANAMVFVDRPPDITIHTPSRALTLAEMGQTIDMMQRFESQLRTLVAAYGPRDALG